MTSTGVVVLGASRDDAEQYAAEHKLTGAVLVATTGRAIGATHLHPAVVHVTNAASTCEHYGEVLAALSPSVVDAPTTRPAASTTEDEGARHG